MCRDLNPVNLPYVVDFNIPQVAMFAQIAPAFLEEILAFLLPLFMTGAAGDTAVARHAALCELAAHDPQTEQEVRLAAQITSFGFGALDSLTRSYNSAVPLAAVLRLRGAANALIRSAQQCQRLLDSLRAQRRAASHTLAQAQALEPAPNTSPVAACQPADPQPADPQPANPQPADPQPANSQPANPAAQLSRQQRRALERETVRLQRRLAAKARSSGGYPISPAPRATLPIPAVAHQPHVHALSSPPQS